MCGVCYAVCMCVRVCGSITKVRRRLVVVVRNLTSIRRQVWRTLNAVAETHQYSGKGKRAQRVVAGRWQWCVTVRNAEPAAGVQRE